MMKRLRKLLLTICILLALPAFLIVNATAYADVIPNDLSGIEQSFSPGDDFLPIATDSDAVATDSNSGLAATDSDAMDSGDESEYIIGFPEHAPRVDMNLPTSSSRYRAGSGGTADETQRYTVLVLDTSSSSSFIDSRGQVFYVADTALSYVKTSAKKFIQDVQSADGTNYVAIVTYKGTGATVVSPFSTDLEALTLAIDRLSASQNTRSVAAGVQAANNLIDTVTESAAVKNVVLFTTGMTNEGAYTYTGHYDESTVGSRWRRSDTQIRLYAYANSAYSAARALKQDATLYTIGLFQTVDDMPEEGSDVVQFFKLSALDLATTPGHFYDVKDPNDLEFVFGEVASSITKKTGIFRYPSGDRDYPATYYYEDSYFYGSSYQYNEHLATMSLCLELSSWNSEDTPYYSDKMRNAKALLEDLGFQDFAHNYFALGNSDFGKPTKDSIGAVAAHKQISVNGTDYTLIAVAVRGGGYEREWASNFTVGASGQHQGFSEARDKVIVFLKDYIRTKEINGNIKLWITGYSRAGATANMVAGKIDEGSVNFANCTLTPNNMYAYTFEAPMGAMNYNNPRDSVFGNIFNIVNESDPVPKVAPAEWEFDRYGVDRFLPSKERDDQGDYQERLTKMKECYDSLESTSSYLVDNFAMKKIEFGGWGIITEGASVVNIVDDTTNIQSQNRFLDDYITMLANDYFRTRSNYVNQYQDSIRDVCGLFFGNSKTQNDRLTREVTERFSQNWPQIVFEFLLSDLDSQERVQHTYELIAQYLRESLDAAGITDYSEADFDETVATLVDLIVAVATDHPNLAATMVKNIGGVGQAHQPELCLSWMQSMDSYYTPGGTPVFSSGRYRVVRINCPVDIEVYNRNGQLVAAIIDDVPQRLTSILDGINGDGEKIFYLPASAEYRVEITATGDGVMSYAVNEYNPAAGKINRLVNYYDVPITEGQQFTGTLPAYNDADLEDRTTAVSATVYTFATNGEEISPSEELSGEAATSAYFYVKAKPGDETLGLAFGSGTRQKGTFAQVMAVARPDSEFVGWYQNGTNFVSAEPEYRFRVDGDINLTAKFVKTGVEISSDASLASLSLGADVILNPAFHTDVTDYTVSVPNSISEVMISAVSSNERAVISGVGARSLNAGMNTIVVTVIAEDGITTAAYTIIVNRLDEETSNENNGNEEIGNENNGNEETDNGDNGTGVPGNEGDGTGESGNGDSGDHDNGAIDNEDTSNQESGNSASRSGSSGDTSSEGNTVIGSVIDTSNTAATKRGLTTASVTTDEVRRAIANALAEEKTDGVKPVITIIVKSYQETTGIDVNLPDGAMQNLINNGVELKIKAGSMILDFSKESIVGIGHGSDGVVTIHISEADLTKLTEQQLIAVAKRPVYDFYVTSGGKRLEDLNGSVIIRLPYKQEPDESANGIVVYGVDANGIKKMIIQSQYNSQASLIAFTVKHSSLYLIDCNAVTFYDVNAPFWALDVIEQAGARGLTVSRGDHLYAPEAFITRAEFTQMIYHLLELPDSPDTASYDDIEAGSWYQEMILAVRQAGVFDGLAITGNRFLPEQPITREEMAVILANAAKYMRKTAPGESIDLNTHYKDYAAMDTGCQPYIQEAVRLGLMAGTSTDEFEPKGFTTRAKAAQEVINTIKVLWPMD